MTEPIWLSREECLAVHEMMIAQFGGAPGVRDEHLLASALARPRQLFAYRQPDLAELAAAYVYGVVRNHPFLDGTMLTGFILGAGFLELNGGRFLASEPATTVTILALAAGELTEPDFTAWWRAHSQLP